MSGIAAARNVLKLSRARAPAPAMGATPRYYSSTMHDNDPDVLEQEKRRNLSKQQHKTSTPIPEAPGWNEHLASASEAAVKDRHHSEDAASFTETEPGVSTAKMTHNGQAVPGASYAKEEIGGPLKNAHGTVLETVEHKEDIIKRQKVL
ncbi:hypothetical protein C8Q80DRAFT_1100636 [Daedaleopsis nitida]|nr:hypothetical protein C8Q80DRAFT_1100636 [Daedaleopsis nitida]